MVSTRLALLAVFMILTFAVLPVSAQYVEMYRVDNLAKELSEADAISRLATHLSVPADTLRQEMKEYGITFGQLYWVNQLAKLSKSDTKSIMAEFRTGKPWSTLAKEKNIKMDDFRKDSRQLEDALKNAKRASR